MPHVKLPYASRCHTSHGASHTTGPHVTPAVPHTTPCFKLHDVLHQTVPHTTLCLTPHRASHHTVHHTIPCLTPHRDSHHTDTTPCLTPHRASHHTMPLSHRVSHCTVGATGRSPIDVGRSCITFMDGNRSKSFLILASRPKCHRYSKSSHFLNICVMTMYY